ncbi:ribosomal protein S18-alanine N-acetyltransferase [Pelomonas sp. SE-A7]|uniref:ribosomal protein S18-alanine N-acetyltransferase n=1 Tax=Pelomonas sp. SE-A7 TaxID=3054953 RepID=UPI00259CF12C|nr:ribosomal protein S18-alanine N-acetyltransferase [Pelomonas sp. SE-A7]MDM4766718.1 ribosomal protein S18-alanine N-acetyltransferase [Pelomonas sp. SE-A7]
MSAQPQSLLAILPLRLVDLEAVLGIEQQSYSFPWTQGNFVDSLAAGYEAWSLWEGQGQQARLIAYFLAMRGFEELHLLNITVHPAYQGQGLARLLLDELCARARLLGCLQVWLEVRESNARARSVYRRYGFTEVGLRRAYYPAGHGKREDAVLMSLNLEAEEASA